MRLYLRMANLGVFLILAQPALGAQNSKVKQERAIDEIKKLGGKVKVDGKRPGRPVIAVNLKHTKVIDASLQHLKALTKIQKLLLKNTTVTDDGIVYVKGLTNLEVLELGRTKVTDKGLAHLKAFTKLRWLDLGGTEVTDRGLAHLKGLRQLRKLDLTGTRVTAAGIQALEKALPKVKIIHSAFKS